MSVTIQWPCQTRLLIGLDTRFLKLEFVGSTLGRVNETTYRVHACHCSVPDKMSSGFVQQFLDVGGRGFYPLLRQMTVRQLVCLPLRSERAKFMMGLGARFLVLEVKSYIPG